MLPAHRLIGTAIDILYQISTMIMTLSVPRRLAQQRSTVQKVCRTQLFQVLVPQGQPRFRSRAKKHGMTAIHPIAVIQQLSARLAHRTQTNNTQTPTPHHLAVRVEFQIAMESAYNQFSHIYPRMAFGTSGIVKTLRLRESDIKKIFFQMYTNQRWKTLKLANRIRYVAIAMKTCTTRAIEEALTNVMILKQTTIRRQNMTTQQ